MPESITLYQGDCLAVMGDMPDASIDAIVTDPPYELGFMGKKWDASGVAFDPSTWAAALRVLKPGGHLVAFGAPKNYHRLACAIEDAGFEIRDSLMWVFGSGFPKSHNVAVAIDKMAGLPARGKAFNMKGGGDRADEFAENGREFLPPYEPATDDAREWQGWGTALKPAYEPIILARKPLIGTVAETVLAHGTGALNIDACRVATDENLNGGAYSGGGKRAEDATSFYTGTTAGNYVQPTGRWPANLVHDGSEEVLAGFPVTGAARAGGRSTGRNFGQEADCAFAKDRARTGHTDDGGSAARFFYQAKASAKDRAGSKHPTVKPIALMRWLVRLITPPGGVVLDPFAGSGTTGQAAMEEGFDAVLIEREPEYVADIERRVAAKPKQEMMAL